MSSKQKNKGASFEREVAKDLSSRYDSSFIRTPHSGAYIGGVNQHRKTTLSENQTLSFKGDIVPPDDWSRLNIECKFYQNFPWHRLVIDVDIPLLEQWLEQLTDVEESDDLSLLVMKFNRLGKFIAYRANFFKEVLDSNRYVKYTSKTHGSWIITDYNNFWELNHNAVQQYCQSKVSNDSNIQGNI